MLNKLKDLCLLDGISGDEGAVREYIIDKIGDKAEIRVDNLGNVIAFCKGKKTPKNKIMVSAHMDEVGMIVTYVNSDGTLKVSSVGGVDPRVVFGRRVKIGRNNVLGVVGGKAIHNLTAEERKKSVPFDKLTIDIGVDSREEALKLVLPWGQCEICFRFCRVRRGLREVQGYRRQSRLCNNAQNDRRGRGV